MARPLALVSTPKPQWSGVGVTSVAGASCRDWVTIRLSLCGWECTERFLLRDPRSRASIPYCHVVQRRVEATVREWLRHASIAGGFLVVVGDAWVGKTRLLYETTRTELNDGWVLAPDLGDGELVNTEADSDDQLPPLVIWLDEQFRFLPGPGLSQSSTAVTAAAVRNCSTPRRL